VPSQLVEIYFVIPVPFSCFITYKGNVWSFDHLHSAVKLSAGDYYTN